MKLVKNRFCTLGSALKTEQVKESLESRENIGTGSKKQEDLQYQLLSVFGSTERTILR